MHTKQLLSYFAATLAGCLTTGCFSTNHHQEETEKVTKNVLKVVHLTQTRVDSLVDAKANMTAALPMLTREIQAKGMDVEFEVKPCRKDFEPDEFRIRTTITDYDKHGTTVERSSCNCPPGYRLAL